VTSNFKNLIAKESHSALVMVIVIILNVGLHVTGSKATAYR